MKGKFIVIDGMDGTGKHTQSELLYNKLKEKYDKVHLLSFPNYDDDSSFFVKKWLSGEYKDIDNPNISALFYILDMAITYTKKIKKLYDDGYIIISDRYYISNILYMLHSFKEYMQKTIFIQYHGILVESCKLPIPDCTIILSSHPEVSNKLLNKRYNNDDSKRDKNENIEFQSIVYNNIEFINHVKDLRSIKNTLGPISILMIHDEKGEIFSIEEMNKKIYLVVSSYLV